LINFLITFSIINKTISFILFFKGKYLIKMAINFENPRSPIKFEEYCNFYGVCHYGDKKTYNSINSIWKLIHKNMQQQLIFPNFELFINYLQTEHDNALPNFKFIHSYVINQFNKYQSNAIIYYSNFKEYNKRLIGYSSVRKCQNMNELKKHIDSNIKRLKPDSYDKTNEEKREFLIIARYICDYLEEYPENMPTELFSK
jgi:hypothetical protein